MKSPTLRLGISNCFAVKRWSEPEEWAEIIASELGLDTFQFSLDLLPPSFGKEAAQEYILRSRAAAKAYNLEPHSVFTGLGAYSANLLLDVDPDTRRHGVEWYKEIIDLSTQLGAQGAGGHIGAFSVRSSGDEDLRRGLLVEQQLALRELAEYAASRGLNHLLFENMAALREFGATIDEAMSLERELADCSIPWVLCLDVGHPVSLTIDSPSANLEAWFQSKWLNTPVVQLQQASRGSDSHSAFTPDTLVTGLVDRETVLGEVMNWPADEIFLFLEVIPPHEADDRQVLDELKQSLEYWREGISNVQSV